MTSEFRWKSIFPQIRISVEAFPGKLASKTEADACVRGFRLLVAAAKADLKGGGR